MNPWRHGKIWATQGTAWSQGRVYAEGGKLQNESSPPRQKVAVDIVRRHGAERPVRVQGDQGGASTHC